MDEDTSIRLEVLEHEVETLRKDLQRAQERKPKHSLWRALFLDCDDNVHYIWGSALGVVVGVAAVLAFMGFTGAFARSCEDADLKRELQRTGHFYCEPPEVGTCVQALEVVEPAPGVHEGRLGNGAL